MKRDEFEKNMTRLLHLLKKILKSHPQAGDQLSNLFDQHPGKVVLNLCLFNFLPVTEEEMDEIESAFREGMEKSAEDGADGDTRNFGWNKGDDDFLTRNGIKF